MKKTLFGLLATIAIGAMTLAPISTAEARWGYGGGGYARSLSYSGGYRVRAYFGGSYARCFAFRGSYPGRAYGFGYARSLAYGGGYPGVAYGSGYEPYGGGYPGGA